VVGWVACEYAWTTNVQRQLAAVMNGKKMPQVFCRASKFELGERAYDLLL
jgi:hypothetical protein